MRKLLLVLALALCGSLLVVWVAASQDAGGRPTEPRNSEGLVRFPDLRPVAPASGGTATTPTPRAPVDPSLLRQAIREPGGFLHFVVEMAEQASLESAPAGLDANAHGSWVVYTLSTLAGSSQASIRAEAESLRAAGHIQQYRGFWIFNGLAVTGDAEALLTLAARADVARIREDRWLQRAPAAPNPSSAVLDEEAEWNLAKIRAPEVWQELGLDGTGAVVAVIDTGADWQHPLLQANYRGYNPHGPPMHEGNWVCTTDEGYLYPGDGNGHGTHVTGIAVGTRDAQGTAVGVAPGAHWIAAKAFNNAGYGYDSWIHAAFEWTLAPAGDPALAPDVVNGSWGSADGDDEVLRPDVQALRIAGIVPVLAAGNGGPGPATIYSPASLPEALSAGASDEVDQVADLSSRGPSPWGEIKPEVVAPGVNIRSAEPGGSYGLRSGTSMAAPHVAGTVALVRQADPDLTVDEIEALLTATAWPIGQPVPNNDAGWGRIDAHEAAATALGAGYLAGSVTGEPPRRTQPEGRPQQGGVPIASAHVVARDHNGAPRGQASTDSGGRYQITIPSGVYDVTAEAFGYQPATSYGVAISLGLTTSLSFDLTQVPSGIVWGTVTDAENGAPLAARISASGTPASTTSDPLDGSYRLTLPEGEYSLQVWKNGFRVLEATGVIVVADGSTEVDAALERAPRLLLVDSGQWYYDSQIRYFEQALGDRAFAYDIWTIRDVLQDVPTLDDLAPFELVIWSAPSDSPGLIGAGDVISSYLSTGGNLLLTGQDVGLWDGGLTGAFWAPYYIEMLKARVRADDAGDGPMVGVDGDLLDGMTLPLNGPDSAQNQDWPDEIALADLQAGSVFAEYAGDGGAALRVGSCLPYRAAYLGAGMEGLGDRDSRAEAMERLVGWLGRPPGPYGADAWPSDQAQVWLGTQAMTYTWTLRNTGSAADQFDLSLSPGAWRTTLWDERFVAPLPPTITLASCQAITVGIQVEVPPDTAWNVTEIVTVTAQSRTDPSVSVHTVLNSKTPAPILLVDDHRWYDMLDRYERALEANHLAYDVWINNWSPLPGTDNPSLERLRRYPIVIWFTGYDWYRTLSPLNESHLTSYLDGGGRLLLSSQDYMYTSGLTQFGRSYLGIEGYTEALTATELLGAVGSPIGTGAVPSAYPLDYPFENWSDAVRPAADASIAYWGQHGQPVALTRQGPGGAGHLRAGREPTTPWKTAFFALPLETIPEPGSSAALGRAVVWLSPLGDSSLAADRAVSSAGDQVRYRLLMRNSGASPLSSVSLSNTVPLSTSYVPGSLVGPAEYDPVANQFTWAGPLNAGAVITVEYSLQFDDSIADGATVTNAAHLSDESGLAFDRLDTVRVNSPELSSSEQHASAAVSLPGQVLTYTLVLRNGGLRPALASLDDPVPPSTTHQPGTAWASSGLVTSTAEAMAWTGTISPAQCVTITFPVRSTPDALGRYILNRAVVDDGWGGQTALEAAAWVETRVVLPLVFWQYRR